MPLRPTHPQFSPRPITLNALGGPRPLVPPLSKSPPRLDD
jgi:hypothetical protein